MESRLAAAAALIVGASTAIAGALEYLVPNTSVAPFDPFATGLFVAAAGVLLAGAGAAALSASLDTLVLRAVTFVGVLTLIAVVFHPNTLLFGGVFWLALVSFGLVAVGSYRVFTLATGRANEER